VYIDEILNDYWDRQDVQDAKERFNNNNELDLLAELLVKVQEDSFRMGLAFAKEGMEYAYRL
jgi:hypothetical protein